MQKVLRKFTKLISEMVVGVERLVFPKEYYFGKRNNVTLREQKKQLLAPEAEDRTVEFKNSWIKEHFWIAEAAGLYRKSWTNRIDFMIGIWNIHPSYIWNRQVRHSQAHIYKHRAQRICHGSNAPNRLGRSLFRCCYEHILCSKLELDAILGSSENKKIFWDFWIAGPFFIHFIWFSKTHYWVCGVCGGAGGIFPTKTPSWKMMLLSLCSSKNPWSSTQHFY